MNIPPESWIWMILALTILYFQKENFDEDCLTELAIHYGTSKDEMRTRVREVILQNILDIILDSLVLGGGTFKCMFLLT